MEILKTAVNIFFGIAFVAVMGFVVYVLFNEIRDAIKERNKKALYQWAGMLVICLVAFMLCKTVFSEQLHDLKFFLKGSPVVTTGDNFSITWERAPEIIEYPYMSENETLEYFKGISGYNTPDKYPEQQGISAYQQPDDIFPDID